MTSSVFRQIAAPGSRGGKAERLFHAAVSAFCSLPRPTRLDLAQIDDLTLPLFDRISPASRRYAAAALSECDPAPAGLVRRLAGEPIDVAAPLLVRSTALSPADLIELIGRHGLSHARAIARRENLHPAIADLVRALTRGAEEPRTTGPAPLRQPGDAAERMRSRLKGMMRDSANDAVRQPRDRQTVFARLRDAALDEHRPFFETALADALILAMPVARRIARDPAGDLPLALHALGLDGEQALVVTAAIDPASAADERAIKTFLRDFASITAAEAAAALRRWRAIAPEAAEPAAWLRRA